jgi:hypothetical protein
VRPKTSSRGARRGRRRARAAGDSVVVHGMAEVELLLQAKVMQLRHRWSSQQQIDVAVVVLVHIS